MLQWYNTPIVVYQITTVTNIRKIKLLYTIAAKASIEYAKKQRKIMYLE